MCYVREYLITSLNSDLRRRLRIKMSLKWWVLRYIMWTWFFFSPERESVYQNSFGLRKGSPNYAWKFQQVSSSQECNLKKIVTIKQARCSYCYGYSEKHRVLVASVRLVCSLAYTFLYAVPDSQIFQRHIIPFFFFPFFIWNIFPYSVAQETRKLQIFFSKLITQGDMSFIHLLHFVFFAWFKSLWNSIPPFFHKKEVIWRLRRSSS